VERDKPRVFPRPDILTIRTTDSGSVYFKRPPRMVAGVGCNLIRGRLVGLLVERCLLSCLLTHSQISRQLRFRIIHRQQVMECRTVIGYAGSCLGVMISVMTLLPKLPVVNVDRQTSSPIALVNSKYRPMPISVVGGDMRLMLPSRPASDQQVASRRSSSYCRVREAA